MLGGANDEPQPKSKELSMPEKEIKKEPAGRLAAAGRAGGVHGGTAAAGGGCACTRCARCGARGGGGE